jgi:flagellar biosynthetic protein FliR
MPSFEPIIGHLVPFALVTCRLAGLFALSPILGNRYLPMRFRALLAIMLSAAVYPGLSTRLQRPPEATLFTLVPLVVSEALIGYTIGFLASLPVMCLDLAGFVMGHQMGLSLSRVYNPDTSTDTDVLGQVLMYIALATFVALGGIEVLFVSLVSTFDRLPIGHFGVTSVPLNTIVGVLSSGMELGVRVALPVMAIVFLLMIAMGFVMKTMPQINILSVGFTIKILFGLGMCIFAVGSMHSAVQAELDRVLRLVLDWGRTVA